MLQAKIIELLVPEQIFMVFTIWSWRLSWSCDLDHKRSFPLAKEAPHKIKPRLT